MIFSTSNREVEISKANDDSYFRKPDVVGIFSDLHPLDYNGKAYLTQIMELPTYSADGDLISRKALLQATVERNSIWNKITDSRGKNLEEIIKELPTIPQTDLTYDMVEQYAKENGFVIWTKEQTEDTLRKLLNYMDTEKQTDSDLAEFLLAKVKDFESVAIRVKHNTENLDRLIDYIHGVIKNAENGTFTEEKQTNTAEWTKEDECSNCGKYVYVGDRDNYCPHCGYKMKEEEK